MGMDKAGNVLFEVKKRNFTCESLGHMRLYRSYGWTYGPALEPVDNYGLALYK
jgi:hypothetical protein